MSGLADRRGDPAYWEEPVRWQRISTRRKPVCDDCVIETHDHRADDPPWPHRILRAMWRRRAGETVTVVCVPHRGEWLAAQMARGAHRPPPGFRRFNQ